MSVVPEVVGLADICLLFEVHQPLRLNRNFNLDAVMRRDISLREIEEIYFDHRVNREIFMRVSERCYLPASRIILEQIDKFRKEKKPFKVSFSISGVFLEQCERWNPDLIEIFRQMVETGCVELLSQTYYHSLASLNSLDRSEFPEQIEMHRQTIKEMFNYTPNVFENTECLYNNDIARTVEGMGFKAIVTEGADRILGWRSPNFVYRASGSSISVLLRNYRLSDDIGFRFTSTQWDQWPLTADKYAVWLAHTYGQVIVLFLDYETFGEHYWADSGILEFLRWLPEEVSKWENLCWSTPSEAVQKYPPCGIIDVPPDRTISWADVERDMSAWLSNPQQNISFNILNEVGLIVKELNNPHLLRIWRYLQTSDHFYYMYTKGGESGIVHDSFNPYGSPDEAFVAYMAVLLDFEARCKAEAIKPEAKYRRLLRRVPADRGFRFFYGFASPTGIVANSLEEFYEALKRVSIESIIFHIERGDFERWVLSVIGDDELASRLASLPKMWRKKDELRRALLNLLEERIKELRGLSGSGNQ
ncbi:MAG: polysaccharide deacetylase family protein [Candidatus Bathyarchaeia archaeon]